MHWLFYEIRRVFIINTKTDGGFFSIQYEQINLKKKIHENNLNVVFLRQFSSSSSSLSLLKIPYFAQVLNSANPLFSIKSREYKIAITNNFIQFKTVLKIPRGLLLPSSRGNYFLAFHQESTAFNFNRFITFTEESLLRFPFPLILY